jgi:glutamine synthetase
MMDLAKGITAFGNKNPMSYFRLVPHQEAPTSICWGYRNRAALVRVPLGWSDGVDMCSIANPQEKHSEMDLSSKQTVEMRSPDGSADIYQLLAGLCVACRHGFEMKDPLAVAKKTYVVPGQDVSSFEQLPDSCAASADCLEKERAIFEEYGVFSPDMIDGIITELRSFGDSTLRADLEGKPAELQTLVDRFFHC